MLNTVLGSFSSGVAASTSSYESIATFTASGGETSTTFSLIAGTYSALQLRVLYRDTYTTTAQTCDLLMQFNGDTTSANYTLHYLRGNGSVTLASGGTSNGSIQMTFFGVSAASTASVYGVGIADIQDYASTTKYKTVRGFGGGDNNGVGTTNYRLGLSSGLWLSTSAITSIKVMPSITAFAAGTTIALYGIKGA